VGEIKKKEKKGKEKKWRRNARKTRDLTIARTKEGVNLSVRG
jgi:hypothetical protein